MVPVCCQNLSSKGGESENILRVVKGITRKGRQRVLVLMIGHKLPLLPLHPHLLRSEGSGRKTWGVIYHVFLHAFLLRGSARRSLSLSILSLTLVATCVCVDPSVCFLRGPKVRHAWVGAWLAKEKLAIGLFMTLELWCWSTISRVVCSQLGIHQQTGHYLRFNGTMVNALRSWLCTASLVGCLSLVGVWCRQLS